MNSNNIWLMERDAIDAMALREACRIKTGKSFCDDADIKKKIAEADNVPVARINKIALLRIHGVIEHRMSMRGFYEGGMSVLAFTRSLRSVLLDPDVSSIIVDIDSPGGEYSGTPELAAEILKARDIKPMIAIANPFAASGAIWLGTAFSELYALPSGSVGSIGAYSLHATFARAYEEMGVDITVIRKPEFKADFNSVEQLTQAAKDRAQKGIDSIYDEFVSAVAKHRGVNVGVVKTGFGEGAMVSAKDAKAAGLVDGVLTFDAVVDLASRRGKMTGRRVSDVMRYTQDRREKEKTS